MAITRTQQYYPTTYGTGEQLTSDGGPYSSKVIRDWIRTVNNLKSYVTPMLITGNAWGFATTGSGYYQPTLGATTEQYVARWAPVPFPAPYSEVRFLVQGKVVDASDSVVFKLYAHTKLYTGANPVADHTERFGADYKVASVTFNSTSIATKAGTVTAISHGVRQDVLNSERLIYLTATATAANASDILRLYTISAWCGTIS